MLEYLANINVPYVPCVPRYQLRVSKRYVDPYMYERTPSWRHHVCSNGCIQFRHHPYPDDYLLRKEPYIEDYYTEFDPPEYGDLEASGLEDDDPNREFQAQDWDQWDYEDDECLEGVVFSVPIVAVCLEAGKVLALGRDGLVYNLEQEVELYPHHKFLLS